VHFHALEMVQDLVHGAENAGEEVATGGEAPNSDPSSLTMYDVLLAAIPEMETPERSKRRVESSMKKVEKIKASRNLDFDDSIPRYALALVLGSNETA
jgi:uncharacterized NAD(P)/FAD-binding protein YdhS